MIELFIGGAMIAVVIFLLGGRPSDPDSRPFVPNDKVAPATSSGSYEAGLAGCPDGTCIASRQSQLTGWTVDRHIAQAYPDKATTQPPPAPRVQPQPARLPAPKPELPPGVTEVPTEVFVKGEWIRVDDLYRR